MTDIVDFLLARIAEDEALARAATPGPWHANNAVYAEEIIGPDGIDVVSGGRWGGEASVFNKTADALHIAANNPARALAECKAKRAIIALHPPIDRSGMTDDELHALFAHPQWEYLTVETGRKSDEIAEPDEEDGEGWEPNDFIPMGTAPDGTSYPKRNWVRFDYTEETYFRRRRWEPYVPPIAIELRILASIYADHPDYDQAWAR